MIAEIVAEHIEKAADGDYSADVARMIVAVIADVLPEVLIMEDQEQRLHEASALSKVSTHLKKKYRLDQNSSKTPPSNPIRDVTQFSKP